MKKRICALAALTALLCAALWLCCLRAPQSAPLGQSLLPDTVEDYSRAIAYVPLDDRPDNLERSVYLAESLGYTVLLPDSHLYATRLDGQERNPNGTGHGDRGALLAWVAEMDALGCDTFLLSCDQLLSGGLVNSRAMTGSEDITFPDGSLLSEEEAIETYLLSLAEDENNRVYLFDSVMRLASTVGYDGFDLAYYNAIRSYGKVPRPEMNTLMPSYEDVVALYPLGAETKSAVEGVADEKERALLTEDVVADYLSARARKLHLTEYLVKRCSEAQYKNFHFMIGVDDSSAEANIQTAELLFIENLLQSRGMGDILLNGVDDLSMMLIARMAQDAYDRPIAVYTEYFGGRENEPATPYDHQVYRDTVTFHVEALSGYEVSDPAEADLQILALSAPAEAEKAAEYVESLLTRLKENEERSIPTIFIDASDNSYPTLQRDLLESISLSKLIGYAGYCDLAIVAGAGVSQGFARYLYLACCEEKSEACDAAFVKSMAEALMLSIPFKTETKSLLNRFIVSSLQLNPDNILGTDTQMALLARKADAILTEKSAPLCENLTGGPIITSLAPYEEKAVGTVSITDGYLPWNRTFEASCTITVGNFS